MHILNLLLFSRLFRLTHAVPVGHESISLVSFASAGILEFPQYTYPTVPHSSIKERRPPPPECADSGATEEQGCFTLAPGQEFGDPGTGSSREVAHCVRDNGDDIAVKRYKNPHRLMVRDDSEKSFKLLKKLEGHPNIITAIAVGKVEDIPALAMELLNDKMRRRIDDEVYKGKLSIKKMQDAGSQLLKGLAHMHSKEIAHLDIAPRNIGFRGDTLKIFDLDYGCEKKDSVDYVPLGDVGWVSPEAIWRDGEPKPDINPYRNDVWAATKLLIWMTTGSWLPRTNSPEMEAIWKPDDPNERAQQIQKKWPEFHPEFVELLADVFCAQKTRLPMDKLMNDFAEVTIYC